MAEQTKDRGVVGGLLDRASGAVSQVAAAGALIVAFIALSFVAPSFLTADNLFNLGSQTSVNAVMAVGVTLVIITGGIDLSVGSVAALSGVLGVMLMADFGFNPLIGVLGGIAVGAIAGLINGLLVSVVGLPPFIATLGMLSVGRGLVLIFTGAVAVFGAPESFRLLGQGVIGVIPIPIVLIAVVAVAGHLVLTRTRLGRYAYVMGSNMEAARLSGVPVRKYTTSVYVLSGALAGLGGMIAASRINSGQPNFGEGLELDVIAAVVIGGASLFGGRGTVVGSLIGAFLVAVIRNGAVQLDISTFYQNVLIGVIIWLAVWWDRYQRRKLTGDAG
ncbi:monosaccharide ABC transporter membrane protein (CUT2 family) [Saccharopolyspora erythraea NRRL 2338]|uniref:Inner-membrane translocator n=2 Tax=Saccharopolyspora erythraea TaxID=1836 RepID=A4FAW9_SACEN|nr:ABC transporter permease [Saccharopolyspora erythraea]EQD87584.1 sugar ABC transporter permease [Saccharopolyspora erythraea D]PFG94976.1 monosaccharide ABC transporter membrane protein (CUT2 family) [Saccharopolyspora erythraea NRRL 2338]QRK91666.1 ABC transporter permease [Saccharopolyspora erythraea]CAM01194.1 inner-membrane translocator [Saccharopolyspora erythraea NRRL 2338]